MKPQNYLKQGIYYTIGDFVNKGAKFLLIPLYINLFSQSEYGQLQKVLIVISITELIIGFGAKSTLLRLWYDFHTIKEQSKVCGTTILFAIILTIIGLIVIFLYYSIDFEVSFFNDISEYLFLIISYSFLFIISDIGLTLYRIMNNALEFGVITFIRTILDLFLIIFFIIYIELSVISILYGGIIAFIIVDLIIYFRILRNFLAFPDNWSYIKDYWSFSFPLLITGALGWFLVSYDQIVIVENYGNESLAIFAFGVSISSVFRFSMEGFIRTISVYLYERLKSLKDIFSGLFSFSLSVFAITLIFFIMFSELVINLIAPHYYQNAIPVSLLMLFCRLLLLINLILFYGLTTKKATNYIAYTYMMSASVFFVACNYFIPMNWIYGGPLSSILSQTVITFSYLFRLNKIFKNIITINTMLIVIIVIGLIISRFVYDFTNQQFIFLGLICLAFIVALSNDQFKNLKYILKVRI